MASPQTENGYIRIANDVLDALCKVRIPGEARQILDCIIRKTYGFNKKSDGIPLSQFAEMTGISRRNCLRALKKLEEMNLIRVIKKDNMLLSKKTTPVVKKDNSNWNIYEFIKDFDKWRVLSKKTTPVVKKDNTLLSKKTPSKDNLSKDSNVPKKRKPSFSDDDMKGAKFLLKKIREHSPHVSKTEKQLESWADVFRRMVEIDKRNHEQIHNIIIFATTDDFWKVNILSAIKLRKHFDTLLTKAISQGKIRR